MRSPFLIGLAAIVAIAIGSVVGALIVSDNERDAFERQQLEEALRAGHQAESVAALSVGQLSGAVAFLQVEEKGLTRREFTVISNSLLQSGALTGTGFLQAVPHRERRSFEREYGFPIAERTALLGDMRRAGPRREYFPVVYGQTASGAHPPLGYDVGADPVRAPFLFSARDSGEPMATPVIRLPIGGYGINVFQPVYLDRAPTATVAERRRALIGFVAGSFRVPALAKAATEVLPKNVEVALMEQGKPVIGHRVASADAVRIPVRIADRTWTLVVHDPNRPGVALPVLMAVFGISLAALLAALVLVWSRNERMRELQRQASQDPLTRLKNRRRFEEDLRTELARSRRERSTGALLMLDLDNFKQVNDTLGHPVGDRVIEEIAGVLGGRTRQTDVLARVGGDEFAIVLPRIEDAGEAERVGRTIASAIRDHVPQPDDVPPITVSVGIAMFGPGTGADFKSVIADADAAMYEAKAAGRDGVRVAGRRADDQPASR
jgi:diguanylate cyclase (GGDEF)-like protein